MKQGELFIKDTRGFLKKLQTVDEIPKGAKFVTAGIVGLYPSVPHDGGLESFENNTTNSRTKRFPLGIS